MLNLIIKNTFQKRSVFALLLFISSIGIAQQTKNFGEGIVVIDNYAFPPNLAVPDAHAQPDTLQALSMRYYIKNDKVLRDDVPEIAAPPAQSPTQVTETLDGGKKFTSGLSATLAKFKYLINYNQKQAICYSYKQDFAAKYSLKDFTFELFYRAFDNTSKLHVDSLATNNPVTIAGQSCYQGMATSIKTGEKITFYYSTQKSTLVSPLNGWFSDFPHNVMLITFVTNWTNIDGSTAIAHFQYRVRSITNTDIPDSTFIIPANIPVLENVPLPSLLNINPPH